MYDKVDYKQKLPNLRRAYRVKQGLEQGEFGFSAVTWVDTTQVIPESVTYSFADLFSGAGGLTLGFHLAGYQPLFGVESDPVASSTFRYNFPYAAHWEGRIEDVDLDVIEALVGDVQLHVLQGGFPCPGFSVAGHRKENDVRNQLYKYIMPFLDRFKPWFVVLENVPGFVTLAKGKFMRDLASDLRQLHYVVSVRILEAAEYAVPQIRPRTVIIANRFGLPNPYPKPILKEVNYVAIEEAINDLRRVPPNPLINHEWTRHSKGMEERIADVPPGGSLYRSYVDAWKRQYPGFPSMTVKENHGGTHIHPELNRVLSARELARLQTFPDSFIFEGTMKRAYFQIGNAVPPLLFKHVALALRPSLDILSHGQLAGTGATVTTTTSMVGMQPISRIPLMFTFSQSRA